MIESTAIDTSLDRTSLLSAAADPVRWRLLSLLAERGTLCVCQLQPVAGVAPNVLSYHLRVLRDAGLVTAAKRGRWVDYTVAPDAHERLATALPTSVLGTFGEPVP